MLARVATEHQWVWGFFFFFFFELLERFSGRNEVAEARYAPARALAACCLAPRLPILFYRHCCGQTREAF